tara:strand:+ start:11035 stop:12558 length:1524 start_codon:yes stop_codon:yes gene_type:complete
LDTDVNYSLIDPLSFKQLFLDDYSFQTITGLKKVIKRPSKQGYIIKPDRSKGQTLVQSNNKPIWNPDINKWELWYLAFYNAPFQGPGNINWGDYHYATSNDGVEWEYPNLGLYEWENSYHNNLAYHSKLDFLKRRAQKNPANISERRLQHLIRDDNDKDINKLYKGLFSNSDTLNRYPAFSSNGFEWFFPNIEGIYSEDTSSLMFDSFKSQFVATVKKRTEWGRSVCISTSKDFIKWSIPKLILHTDEIDMVNRQERINFVLKNKEYLSPPKIDMNTDYIAQLYLMPIMNYQNLYIGFPLIFNPAGPDLPQMNHCGLNQTELAVSRNFYDWERVANRDIFIGIDPWDGISYDTTQVSICGSPIIKNNEIWIYYQGARFRGSSEIYHNKYKEYFNDFGALGLAKLRLDGFVSLFAENYGQLITKPFKVSENILKINANSLKGNIKVSIVDAQTLDPLPNFSLHECDILVRDNIDIKVSWNGNSKIKYNKPIRVIFNLKCSEIYSFWIE